MLTIKRSLITTVDFMAHIEAPISICANKFSLEPTCTSSINFFPKLISFFALIFLISLLLFELLTEFSILFSELQVLLLLLQRDAICPGRLHKKQTISCLSFLHNLLIYPKFSQLKHFTYFSEEFPPSAFSCHSPSDVCFDPWFVELVELSPFDCVPVTPDEVLLSVFSFLHDWRIPRYSIDLSFYGSFIFSTLTRSLSISSFDE